MKDSEKTNAKLVSALTVAGSDSGGGAGIQADLLTFASLGVHGLCAIAALTSQNPSRVAYIAPSSVKSLLTQLDAVESYFRPTAAKCGMLFSAPLIRAAAKFFGEHKEISLVVDPVCVSTSGARLLKSDALETLKFKLMPLASLITPNLDEAALLLDCGKISAGKLDVCAKALARKFGVNVLLKGGHLKGENLVDTLCSAEGDIILRIASKRVEGVNTHGSGCTLSAAITAFLAGGLSLEDACLRAHEYVHAGMLQPVRIAGENFINRFPKVLK